MELGKGPGGWKRSQDRGQEGGKGARTEARRVEKEPGQRPGGWKRSQGRGQEGGKEATARTEACIQAADTPNPDPGLASQIWGTEAQNILRISWQPGDPQ